MAPETTDFLYPFIEGGERDVEPLLADLAASAEAKAAASLHLRSTTVERCAPQLAEIAAAMAKRFEAGAKLFTFGNGGSATDAEGLAALFRNPPSGLALRARSLAEDLAVVTALGNDVGFELVYSRQLIAFGQPADIAVGISTSGNSVNLLHAFAEARRRGMLTLGLSGGDGGQMAAIADLDYCLVARADSVHRVQETQAALAFDLWCRIQALLDPPSGGDR